MPGALVEVGIGITAAMTMVAARLAMGDIAGDRAPYALNFLAVVLAALVAGWRAGLIALVLSQLLTWYAIVPPHWSMAIADPERLGGFIIASTAESLVLLIVALYQREVDKGVREREQRLQLLNHALNEMDHRTTNNYQTVLALVHLQAQRSSEPNVKTALEQVTDRITAIAKASERMAMRSADLQSVRLDDHLCELCDHIEKGLSRDEIKVACDITPCSAHIERVVSISIIVNELVTNALKHAFDDGSPGRVEVAGHVNGGGFELTVTDNGRGMKPSKARRQGGLGTKLIDTFVRQLGAQHEVVASDKGTMHRLVIPELT